MSVLGTKIQAGFEPIPGYVLTKKLGSGGYGDVWSADAPGGLKKAIKFVYGSVDEDRAAAELKSLQRVRQVNHPFILSLERIEIVEGQLLIVTELAQGSLHDRFLEFRKNGFAGIARDRLLAYLKDAADGLDFLCQKHELQHLDVKPGNMLLVSDRIKIADFGLVKDLHSMSQSLLGGLTPTYAAPEMFDGRPGRYSDQYSLAIVYQEMLTGTLPFRGRTTAQLANEHLNKAPNLEELPIAERPVIAKALAKRPQHRFSDCRELVTALEQALEVQSDTTGDKVRVRGWSPKGTTGKLPNQRTSTRSPFGASGIIRSQRDLLEQGSVKAPTQFRSQSEAASRKIILGIGGTGAEVAVEMKHRFEMLGGDELAQPRFVVMDTDPMTFRNLSEQINNWNPTRDCSIHAPLKSPHYYRDETSPFPQLSRRWLYNIPRSQTTEGVRPLGMLALIDHASEIYERLGTLLNDITQQTDKAQAIQVRMVVSAMGGTGSAMVCEVGFLLRQIGEVLEVPIHCELVLTCAAPSPSALGDLASASAISSLLEIQHFFRTDGLHPALPNIPASHSNKPPFDSVRLFYGGQSSNRSDRQESVKQIADYLMLPSQLPQPTHQEKEEESQPLSNGTDSANWLSTLRVSPFPLEGGVHPSKASSSIFLRTLLAWIATLEGAITSAATSQSILVPPKVLERLEFLVTDTFRICNWNAQAWVRDVMRAVLPDEATHLNDFRSKTQGSACSLEYLNELKQICDPLGVDLSESSISIQQLFECRYEKLFEVLTSWLLSVNHWGVFPKVLELIEERIRVNSHSLFSVAKKLEERIQASSEEESSGTEENMGSVAKVRSKIEMEAVFHRLSGNLLLRFVDRLEILRTLWLNSSIEIHSVFAMFGESLCQAKFGYSMGQFLSNNPPLKIDSLNRLSGTSFSEIVMRQWIDRGQMRDLFLSLEDRQPGKEHRSQSLPLEEQLKQCHERIRQEFVKHSTPQSNGSSLATEGKEAPSENVLNTSVDRTVATKTAPPGGMVQLSSGSSQRTADLDTKVQDEFAGDGEDTFDLDSKIESCIPYLADFGESVRLYLYTSELTWFQLSEQMQGRIEQTCHVYLSRERMSTYMVAEGTQLDLEELIDKVWMPTNETWQLVPRILSRVDIEWLPFRLEG